MKGQRMIKVSRRWFRTHINDFPYCPTFGNSDFLFPHYLRSINFTAHGVCWVVFINLPDSSPFSTFFHPTLCRRNPLHRPPLPGSPAIGLLVSSATPRKEEKICICHLTVAVSLQVLAGSLSQATALTSLVTTLVLRPTGWQAITALQQPLSVSLKSVQRVVVPSWNSLQLPLWVCLYIGKKIKVKARGDHFLPEKTQSSKSFKTVKGTHYPLPANGSLWTLWFNTVRTSSFER